MTKTEFQNAHGAAWAAITQNPAFFAALQICSADKLQRIASLSNDEIKENGHAILAGFRDHIQLENALIDLAVAEPTTFFDLPPETYKSSDDSGESATASEEPIPGSAFHQFQAAAQQQPDKPKTKKPCQKSRRRKSP